MMLARKWDRIENLVKKHGYDVFNAIDADPSNNGPIDDIRDLRRYLLLVEAEMTVRGAFAVKEEGPEQRVFYKGGLGLKGSELGRDSASHGQGPMVPRFEDGA